MSKQPTSGASPQQVARLLAAAAEGARQEDGAAAGSASSLIGTRIDSYRIVAKLGEGGSSVVYLAEQTDPVRRRVALKILKAGMDTKDVISRFEAEKQALAIMEHPAIAKVFDAGLTDTGQPYFAMEFVKGEQITKYCENHKLTLEQRLRLFVRVCEAVQHAHQKGVIHRDLKPTNVLITVQDGEPAPKVIDFGIAKAMVSRLTDRTLVTAGGQLLGTPAYMSPEQASGHAEQADTRTDTYGLGAILFELLTGELPHDVSGPPWEVYQRVASEDVRRPRDVSDEIDRDLEAVLLKALAHSPDHRYPSAGVLATDVVNYLTGDPLLARKPTTMYFLCKRIRRYRIHAAVAATVLLGLLGMAAYAYYQSAKARGMAERVAATERDASIALRAKQTDLLREMARVKAERERADVEATRATEQARRAVASLGAGFCAEAAALGRAGDWDEAKRKYAEAFDVLDVMGTSATLYDVGLAEAYQFAPPPLVEYERNWGGGNAAFVAVSPDCRLLAAGTGGPQVLRVWDARTGVQIWQVDLKVPPWHVAFSPDGRHVALGTRGKGNEAGIWDARTGLRVCSFGGDEQGATPVFSSDGNSVFTARKDLYQWDVRSGALLRRLPGPTGGDDVWGLTSAPARRFVAFGGPASATVWDLEKGTCRTFSGFSCAVFGVAISPDEMRVATSGHDRIRIWDLRTGRLLKGLPGHGDTVTCLSYSPDGRYLCSSGRDSLVKVWDVQTGSTVRYLTGQGGDVPSFSASADWRFVAAGCGHGFVRLWPLWPVANRLAVCLPDRVMKIVVSPDSRVAAFATPWRSEVDVWDIPTRRRLLTIEDGQEHVCDMAFSQEGHRLLLAARRKRLTLWDLETGRRIQGFLGRDQPGHVALAPDGRHAVIGNWDGSVEIWDVEIGQKIRTLGRHSSGVADVCFGPKGRQVASVSGGDGSTLRVWRADDGSSVCDEGKIGGRPTCLAWHPQGNLIACGNLFGAIHVWDFAANKTHCVFAGHDAPVKTVAFSRDGKMIFSAGQDGTARWWDLPGRRQVWRLPVSEVWQVALSPDEGTLLANTPPGEYIPLPTFMAGDGSERLPELRIWDLELPSVYRSLWPTLSKAKALLRRDPKDAEALHTFGTWYAARRVWDWATEFLEAAQKNGHLVSPLMLARCYWQVGRHEDAIREFNRAIAEEEVPAHYLRSCMEAVKREAKGEKQGR